MFVKLNLTYINPTECQKKVVWRSECFLDRIPNDEQKNVNMKDIDNDTLIPNIECKIAIFMVLNVHIFSS